MTTLEAVEIIEGTEYDEESFVSAYQALIDSRVVWKLQGSYGLQAAELIRCGACTPTIGSLLGNVRKEKSN